MKKNFPCAAKLPASALVVIACGTLGAFYSVARADTSAEPGLEEVVVVATRAPQSLDKVGNSVTVLTETEIQARQSVDIPELLASSPGITFSRSGGPGQTTSLNIRGADSDHTVVLIDGVVLNDPSSPSGGLDFGNLIVGDITRIEILRGAQSTLYGSQAIGGVINIETAEPHDGIGGDLQGEKGTLVSGLTKGGVGGKWDNFSFRLGATYYSTDSVSAFDRQYGGVETDPYRNAVFSGRANYDFTPSVGLDLRAYYTKSKVDYDGFPPPNFVLADEGDFQLTRQFVDYTGVHFDFFDGMWKNRVAYQYTITDRGDFLDDGTSITQNDGYTGTNSRFEYQGTVQIADGYRTVFGLQQEKYLIDSLPAAPGAHADTGDNSAYLQLQAEVVKGLTVTAGERFDHYDSFGKHATGQAALAWALPSSTVLRASFGQGFKAPSLTQLYSIYGNPDVNAERSKDFDAGVEQHLLDNRLMLSATYFHIDFTNLIEFNDCPGSPLCFAVGHSAFGYYSNLGKARSSGVELQATAKLSDALALSANYTHTKLEDRTPGSPTFGMPALRRPADAANLEVSYVWPVRLTTAVSARYSGASFDENFNVFPEARIRLGGYTLWDLRASYAHNDHYEIYARCDNCSGKRYETVYQYGAWGRTAVLGGRIKY